MFTKLSFIIIMMFLFSNVYAEITDEDKVKILTNYLVQERSQGIDAELSTLTHASPEYKALKKKKASITMAARNEAVATVYGKPKFESLVYDDGSEMFFGRIVSTNGNFEREVNFYMPKKRARAFKKKLDKGRIEIEHAFENSELVFKEIELSYRGVEYPLHVQTSNTFTLKLGGYFIGVQDTELSTTKNGIGATLNLQDLFDMKEKVSVARMNMMYKFNPKHRIEASWYALKSTSSNNVSTDFIFDGKEYQASADISFYMNIDTYKINYVYAAYQTNKLELSFRVGLHITSLSTGLTAGYNVGDVSQRFDSDSLSITAPLPVIGLGLNYEIIPALSLTYTIDYFAISYDSTVSGSMVDSLLSLDYQFNRYIGIGGGVNTTNMRFSGKTEGTELKYNDEVAGLIGYVILSY